MHIYVRVFLSVSLYSYITRFTCHSWKGILTHSKDLLRRDPPIFVVIPKVRLGMPGICRILQAVLRVLSGCSSQDHFALSFVFFNQMKHIACNSLIYCMLPFVIILLYYCRSANPIETPSCHFIGRFCSVTVYTGQACGPVQHSVYHLGVCLCAVLKEGI